MTEDVRKQLVVWLFGCCTLLFVLIVVGGATRLTRSGLSIVEWQPIVGILPPLDEAQWLQEFDKYRRTPEYQQVNRGMNLQAFKGIYWWEYAHRLLGRLLGMAFLVPLLWFALSKRIDRRFATKLAVIFVLGALQGGLGWFMVKSGLVDDPRVSHLRLTAHLGLAFLIFAAMFWLALDLRDGRGAGPLPAARRLLVRFAFVIVGLIFAMVLSGGLVAGLRAGLAYNTFPLMNGHLIPPEIFMIEPWYLNFVNNMATVQFDHRLLGVVLAIFAAALWTCCKRVGVDARTSRAVHVLLAALALQIGLGVATLLLRVPVALGAAHQGIAVLVFAAALWAAHSLRTGPGRARNPA